ncbi:MAG TPA: universal stress protein [Desulfotignum sp.]|jgi:nucleotide-binding universal stress UspA family protein|nr:universal stress protein [Desulfotignum sp.]
MDAKKILVAVDGSENARRSINYVADIIKDCRRFEITLLSIEHLPDRDFFADDAAWKKACAENRDAMLAFLADGKQLLAEQGVSEKLIHTDYIESCHSPMPGEKGYCSRGTSIALDILHAAKDGGFGTVVIGRRGVSKAEEFMFGSVSNKIIHSGRDCTIWVVQ